MEINHELLLTLGFTALSNRPDLYVYKGVSGKLMGNGTFQVYGFSLLIEKLSDLRYMLMLVDNNYYQASEIPYPYHYN
ncbi:hypothetical protein [Spirosoma pulveris]